MTKGLFISTALVILAAGSGYAVAMFQAPTWQDNVPAIVKQVAMAKEKAKGDPLLEAAVNQMEASVTDEKGQKQVESLLDPKPQGQPMGGAGKSSTSQAVALTALASPTQHK